MLIPGTTSPNPATRYAGLPAEALRKPPKLLGLGQDFVLLPHGQDLAMSCLRLAYKLAGPFKIKYPLIAEEFDGVAALALVRAAAFFNPTRGTKFTTYAHHSILKACEGLPRLHRQRGYRRSAQEGPQLGPLHPQLDIATVDDPSAALEHAEDSTIVGTVMARLDPRLADILRRRHLEGQTFQEIGDVYGLTREYIRQLELRACMQIRESGIAG